MKKAIIINCFASANNEYRSELVVDYFSKHGFSTIHLTSDFSHHEKKYYKCQDGRVQLHVLSYNKNLSLSRILSHIMFSRKVYSYIKKENPEYIYVKIPPNCLTYYVAKYKKKNKHVKVYADVYDLWPESMPIQRYTNRITACLFKKWSGLRDSAMKYFDKVFIECRLYLKYLEEDIKYDILYLAKPDGDYKSITHEPITNNVINLCYIGGINEIIDIQLIGKIVKRLSDEYKVIVHIIGDGEKKNDLLECLHSNNADIVDYGIVYDDSKKKKIFEKCQFGINIMKPTVVVGLTTKSVEYLRAGLPIINNIKDDTYDLVKNKNIGINISTEENIKNMCSFIYEYDKMQVNAKNVYNDYFSVEAFEKKLKKNIEVGSCENV